MPLNKSDGQANNDKYRVLHLVLENYYIIMKSEQTFDENTSFHA